MKRPARDTHCLGIRAQASWKGFLIGGILGEMSLLKQLERVTSVESNPLFWKDPCIPGWETCAVQP